MILKHNRMQACILMLFVLVLGLAPAIAQNRTDEVDVCVYGGNSAGVIAAYTAAKMNKKVILIEPDNHLGGLSSGGLGFTDIGNKYVVSGLARDFYRRIGQNYGKLEQWTFEPKVAEAIFQDYVKRGGFEVRYQTRLKKVNKKGATITSIELESDIKGSSKRQLIRAKQFIDCTYEGDLMAKAGVEYTTGREANDVYNETVNGVQLKDKHQFPDGIDPYKIPGKPESGLLWGISPEVLKPIGSGDKKIQAYNFRICLTNDPENRIAITKPSNYDPTHYELFLRQLQHSPAKSVSAFLSMDMMPNRKTDINNNGPFSTDAIGMNYAYPEADYASRKKIIQKHEDYTKGFLYFIGNDPAMPKHLREEMLQWGYPKDEYLNNNHWSPQLYVREARRMVGVYVMTQANCEGREVVSDKIGMGAYSMDSHNTQRLVVNGMVKNEGDVQLHSVKPYPIAYRSITPKSNQCTNLLVPVCISSSHMAFGSIRMEPVFMVLAQSAAVAACQAIDQKKKVQDIDINKLQSELTNNPLADHSMPDILVDNDDPQRAVKTGNWSRETHRGYGPSYFKNSSSVEDAEVKFTPTIVHPSKYQVYLYCPKLNNNALLTQIEIFDGNNKVQKTIHRNDIKVIGQTSGEWVSLGLYEFPVGEKAYVKVSNRGADGDVVADAVLLVPKI